MSGVEATKGDVPAEDSEMPAARAAASSGKRSQERFNASKKGDGSPEDEIVKVWSQKATGWRSVFAKYVDVQIAKGEPGYGDEKAWTSYRKQGWFKHEEGFEFDVEDPDKDKSSSYTWAEYSSNKDNASTSSRKKGKG